MRRLSSCLYPPLLLAFWLLFLVAWCVAVFRAPTTVGWRDSGEFILTSYFLDIPHPAGFPVYSHLSNFFSLIIPGPIAWRTHIFSLLVLSALLYQMVELSKGVLALLRKEKKGEESPLVVFTILILTTSLIGSTTLWRTLETAEVYGLHALFLTIILRLLLSYSDTRDVRLLYAASLLGGFSLGNHVVGILFGAWILLGLLLFKLSSVRVLFTCALFGLAGLSTYAYLPARSLASPPFNTGAPHTLSRFLLHVSDARDRDLRPHSESELSPQSPSLTSKIITDVQRGISDISLPLALMSASGAILIVWRLPFVGFCLVGGILTTVWFFMGWDLDPWIPATSLSVVLAATLASYLVSLLEARHSRLQAILSVAALTIILTGTIFPRISIRLRETPSESAIHFAEDTLKSVAPHGVFISDSSWFIARYAQAIEGIAPTVTSMYLPSLLFPKYFNPVQLSIGQERFVAEEGSDSRAPEFRNLFQLINLASVVSSIQIDPNIVAIAPLKDIIQLDATGTLQIRRGESATISQEFIPAYARRLQKITEDLSVRSNEELSDGDEHIKIELLQTYSTLKQLEHSVSISTLCTSGAFRFITDQKLTKSAAILQQICSSH